MAEMDVQVCERRATENASRKRGRSGAVRNPGVSYVSDRALHQAQCTVSTKLHLGNFKDASQAAHALSLAKTRLKDMGFIVRLGDGEPIPELTPEAKLRAERRTRSALLNFKTKWRRAFLETHIDAPRKVAIVCVSSDAGCVERGEFIASHLAAGYVDTVIVQPVAGGGWVSQHKLGGPWLPLHVDTLDDLRSTHEMVTVNA